MIEGFSSNGWEALFMETNICDLLGSWTTNTHIVSKKVSSSLMLVETFFIFRFYCLDNLDYICHNVNDEKWLTGVKMKALSHLL